MWKLWFKRNFSVLLFASALIVLGVGMAFSQTPPSSSETCAEGRDLKTVTETYQIATGVAEYNELKNEFIEHFRSAYLSVTGAETPEGMDLLQIFPMPSAGIVALVAYKKGCALGSATVPLSVMEAVTKKMQENRAGN